MVRHDSLLARIEHSNKEIAGHLEEERAMEAELQKLRDFFKAEKEHLQQHSGKATVAENQDEIRLDESNLRFASLEKRMRDLQRCVRAMDDENLEKFESLNREIDSLKLTVSSTSDKSNENPRSFSDQSSMTSSVQNLQSGFIESQISDSILQPKQQIETVTSSVTSQTQTIVGNGQSPSNPQPVNTITVQTSSGNSSSATSSSVAPTSEDALPIPILPVQTVEAMAAAAKGGVRSIKQLINTLQGSTDEAEEDFHGCWS